MKRYLILLAVALIGGYCASAGAVAVLLQRATPTLVGGQTSSGGAGITILVDADGTVHVTGSSSVTGIVTVTGSPNSSYGTPFNISITAIPSTSGSVATASTVLMGSLYCANITTSPVTMDVTNTAGTAFVKSFSIPENSDVTRNFTSGQLAVGVKWWAGSAASVDCALTGWTTP